MTQKEIAYKKIAELIERFDEHIDEYKRGSYNTTKNCKKQSFKHSEGNCREP